MLESIIAMIAILLLFLLLFNLSDGIRAKLLVENAAAKCARARAVGYNDFMLRKIARLSTMPAAGKCLTAADAGGGRGDKALLDSFMLKNVVFVGVHIKDNHVDLAMAEQMSARYGDRAVGLKIYFDTTISEVSDLTPLRECCELARKKGLRVMVHCSHSPVPMAEILDTLGAGDILTHAFHGGESNAAEDGFESIRRAQERGVVIDAGMAGYVHTDFKVFEKAIQSGILPDVISTDITRYSAYVRGGRYGMTMCMNIAKTLGMKEEDIFRAVTSNPAKILGKENEWGRLKVGAQADIAVFDYTDEGFDLTDGAGNHICNTKGYRCVLTVSDGQVVFRD